MTVIVDPKPSSTAVPDWEAWSVWSTGVAPPKASGTVKATNGTSDGSASWSHWYGNSTSPTAVTKPYTGAASSSGVEVVKVAAAAIVGLVLLL
jgi:hypothetical protein